VHPNSAEVQKAMEDAMCGKELPPKVQLVESSSMATAQSLLQMEPIAGGAPLLGPPPSGPSGRVWEAFKPFAKK
jgi:hypothetical protein